MITFQNTPNNAGIVIRGEYQDLKSLYDAIFNYTDLIQPNLSAGLRHPEDAQVRYELILSLCYDLRKAYTGNREMVISGHPTLSAEKINELKNRLNEFYDECHENSTWHSDKLMEIFGDEKDWLALIDQADTIYSVDVLYPWFVYLLFELQNVLEHPIEYERIENMDFHYSLMQIKQDRSIIQDFILAAWNHIAEFLDADWARNLVLAASAYSEVSFQQNTYAQIYCSILWNHGNTVFDKQALLALFIYEMMDRHLAFRVYPILLPQKKTVWAGKIREHLKEEKDQLIRNRVPFLSAVQCNREIIKLLTKEPGLNQNDILERYYEKFGDIDDEEII